MASTTSPTSGRQRSRGAAGTAFSVLLGLTSLGVLLQGLWAGLMVPLGDGGPYRDSWVEVHGTGADVTIVLALLTAVLAVWTFRDVRPLWTGCVALLVLLALEAFLGGLISDDSRRAAAAVHVPLALALMGLAVWLPLAARRSTRSARTGR